MFFIFILLIKGQFNEFYRLICMFELSVLEKFRCKVYWLEYLYMYIIDGGSFKFNEGEILG